MSDQVEQAHDTENLANVPLEDILENPVALRTVNRNSEDYLELVESIKEKGILSPPSVRLKIDEESGEEQFELVDGLHRFTAAKDAGLDKIPVHILEMDDAEVLEAQIVGNLHQIKTKPSEYTQQLKAILTMNPLMTEAELAQKLGASLQFIQQRLSLTKIENEDIMKLVDDGTICLSNAYTLAKLPVEEQAEFLDRAMTQKPDEFTPAVTARVKEIRENRRKGKDGSDTGFQPTPHLQKAKDLKEEMETNEIGTTLIAKHDLGSPQDAWNMAIKWMLHMDPDSVEAQKADYEARKKAREDAKTKKRAEKAEAKQKKLQEEMQKAAEEAEKAKAALEEQEAEAAE